MRENLHPIITSYDIAVTRNYIWWHIQYFIFIVTKHFVINILLAGMLRFMVGGRQPPQVHFFSLTKIICEAPRGFGDSGRSTIYLQGFWEKGHLFQGFGEKAYFWGVLVSRGLRKNILGDGEKGHFSFREQGAKIPLGPHLST